MLARADLHGLGADREALAALEVDVAPVAHQREALPVHRDVDVVEALPPPRHERHGEDVLAVGREGVQHADPPARAEGGAGRAFPFVLRDRGRVGVRGGRRRRVAVADRPARDLAGRRQVGVHQRGGQGLLVRDVVEALADPVLGQPLLGIDGEAEQVVDHPRVLGPVEPLERPRPHEGTGRGRRVHRLLQCAGEGLQGVPGGAGRARRRHHPRAQLADHALGDVGVLGGACHVEAHEDQVAEETALVVAAGAVLLDDFGEGGRGWGGKGLGGRWESRSGSGERIHRNGCPARPRHQNCAAQSGEKDSVSHWRSSQPRAVEPMTLPR